MLQRAQRGEKIAGLCRELGISKLKRMFYDLSLVHDHGLSVLQASKATDRPARGGREPAGRAAGPGSRVAQGLVRAAEDNPARQRPGVRQYYAQAVVPGSRGRARLHPAWQADAERLCRTFQQNTERRGARRARVQDAGGGSSAARPSSSTTTTTGPLKASRIYPPLNAYKDTNLLFTIAVRTSCSTSTV